MDMANQPSDIEIGILDALKYFSVFSFAPNEEELYIYTTVKSNRAVFRQHLSRLIKKGRVYKSSRWSTYSLPEMRRIHKLRRERRKITDAKLSRASKFLRLASRIPSIELIGLSGSCSMDNAQRNDDVDIFIITRSGRMWTSRMALLILAQILGIRRKRTDTTSHDSVCINLIFDAVNIVIPESKRNLYTAHEVVQMRPIHIRGGVYERFMTENSWVRNYLPNARKVKGTLRNDHEARSNRKKQYALEGIMKRIQLAVMKPHITSEIISDDQLWFYPNDFEDVIRSKIKIDN